MAKPQNIPTITRKDYTGMQLMKHSLFHQTKEFFNNSTLHGVRYISEPGRPFSEKFMWFCFIAIGAVSATIIIVSLWGKFQTNPTITGLDTDFHNQLLIFPSVTVCPSQPYDEEEIKEIGQSYNVAIADQLEPFLQALTSLSYETMHEAYDALEDLETETYLQSGAQLRTLAFKAARDCNSTFQMCIYKDENVDCCDIFDQVYTENGFCFIFNAKYRDMVDKEEFIAEKNHLSETDKKWGLKFLPYLESKVFLHSYTETSGADYVPQVVWEVNYAVDLLISMKQTYTTEQAKQLSIRQRKCIFPEEIKMAYRREEYTFTGCMRECRIANSLRICGCVAPFYVSNVKNLKYCGSDKFECLAKYATNITNINFCKHCELSCQNTVYDIEKYSKLIKTEGTSAEEYVNIEYLTWPIIRYKREWVDLLVSFGGIAGLFLGFSLLSIVEIVYYFTLCACCMVYKNRRELYEIIDEKLQKPPVRYSLTLKPSIKGMTKRKMSPPTPINDEKEEKIAKAVLLGTKHLEVIPKLRINGVKSFKSKVVPLKEPPKRRWKLWSSESENPYGGYLH